MHEVSLVKALLRQVGQLAAENRAASIEEIRVETGPLAGVEPLLLHSAFERIAPQTIAAAARLVIQDVPLEGRCQVCERQFEILSFQFLCPVCNSHNVEVTRGDALVLESVTISQRVPSETMT
jgi:hydrogenase nickel incorporation protein HypA/HybF